MADYEKQLVSDRDISSKSNGYLTFSSTEKENKNGLTVSSIKNPFECSDEKEKAGLLSISWRRLFILFLCTFANIMSGMAFSLPAPFYPQEALKRGVSSTVVGVVFSSFNLVVFLVAPLFGNYLTRIGTKFTHLSSVFCGGTTTILFGTLHMCPSIESFVVLSLLCRMLYGVGYGGFSIASLSIVSNEFPDNVASVFGIIQIGVQIGFMAGPVIGGALYDFGGFGLPFYVLGGSLLVCGLLLFPFLPSSEIIKNPRKRSMLSLLKLPSVFVPMISVAVGAISAIFLQPTLATHLEPLNLSATELGVFFFIMPLLCCASGPVWGFLSDKKGLHEQSIVLCHLVVALGFLILSPVFPFSVTTVVMGLSVIGLSIDCTLLATLKCMIIGAIDNGFDDNMDTYGMVSGLLNLSYYLGGVIGPLVGGGFQFETGTEFVVLLNIIATVICATYFLGKKIRHKLDVTVFETGIDNVD